MSAPESDALSAQGEAMAAVEQILAKRDAIGEDRVAMLLRGIRWACERAERRNRGMRS